RIVGERREELRRHDDVEPGAHRPLLSVLTVGAAALLLFFPVGAKVYSTIRAMPRPIRATISAGAMTHNLLVAKAYAAGAKVWAVIKANAYGHGIERAAAAF